MKFKNFVVYEIKSDKFDIGHCWIKVKVTVGVQKFSPFTAIQTVRSSTLIQAIKQVCSLMDIVTLE